MRRGNDISKSRQRRDAAPDTDPATRRYPCSASKYWVKSFEPTDRNSASSARAPERYTAAAPRSSHLSAEAAAVKPSPSLRRASKISCRAGQFIDSRHHRQQNTKVVQALISLEHRPNLCQKIQGDRGHPDSAPSQKWIGPQSGSRAMPCHRQYPGCALSQGRMKGLKLLLVELPLLLLAGKPSRSKKLLQCGKAQHPQRHIPAARCTSAATPVFTHSGTPQPSPLRQAASPGRQFLKQCFILGKQTLEARQQISVRVDINRPL